MKRKRHLLQHLLIGATSLCAAVAFFCGFLYYNLYWQYRDSFDAQGRYFDEATAVVYHDQASVLGVPALLFSVLTLLFAGLWFRRRFAALRASNEA